MTPSKDHVVVIGAGFGGLTSSALMAQQGARVTLLEKHTQTGGRARTWESDGFMFDLGPSWYWMPDVFEAYYNLFGKTTADFYNLVRLDPGYRVWFGKDDFMDIPAGQPELEALFESVEPGSGLKLRKFLDQAAYKYQVGMQDYVFRPSHSITEFIDIRMLMESFRIQMFRSMAGHVKEFVKNPRLVSILEFPVLFLGATPKNIPALYSMMNYADLRLGTWYPMGGMHKISEAMTTIAREQGVRFELGTEVSKIEVKAGKAHRLQTNKGAFEADWVVTNADYHHADQHLLDPQWRTYNESYWENRVMSPSSLLFYLGIKGKVDNLKHHNLFFDEDFYQHAKEIYETPQWPTKPLFYVCCPSKTDPSVAPEGDENLFILAPLAPGLKDDPETREKYYQLIMERLERLTGQTIRGREVVKRSYAMDDFVSDYHAYKGNAYGLANTLLQTAFFKPKMRARKVSNLYFTGQLTVPGPGVPPSIISGRVVAAEVLKEMGIKFPNQIASGKVIEPVIQK